MRCQECGSPLYDEGRYFVCSNEQCGKRLPKFAFGTRESGKIWVSGDKNLMDWLLRKAVLRGLKDIRRKEME